MIYSAVSSNELYVTANVYFEFALLAWGWLCENLRNKMDFNFKIN